MPVLTVFHKRKNETVQQQFDSRDTIKDVKLKLLKNFHKKQVTSIMAGVHNCVVLKLTFPDGTHIPLTDHLLTVQEIVQLPSYAGAILEYKYVGPQINYRLVFILEYLGPILILVFLYSQPEFLYGAGTASEIFSPYATVGFALWILHFIKREFETIFVHKFSRETMPLFNLFKNSAHYWSAAIYVGWPLCSPSYTAPLYMNTQNKWLSTVLISTWTACQIMNFAVHLYFSQMRKADGDTRRPMPIGPLFSVV